MKCPKCQPRLNRGQQEMLKKFETVTNNGKSGKDYREYNKIVYWCQKDDIWISIEVPVGEK